MEIVEKLEPLFISNNQGIPLLMLIFMELFLMMTAEIS